MAREKGRPGRKQLTSVSLPFIGGGIGGVRAPGEYEVMHALFGGVGGLTVLSWSIEGEGEQYVNQSVLNIRDKLSEAVQALPRGSGSLPNVRGMRDACNQYLRATPGPASPGAPLRPHFAAALVQWRIVMYEEVKSIAYALDLEEAKILMRAMQKSFNEFGPPE